MKPWLKNTLMYGGAFLVNVAAHTLTATPMVKVKRSVMVTGLSDRKLEIEEKGKRESLPLVIEEKEHLDTIWNSMRNGKRIDLVLNCLISMPNTDPTLLRAEILEVRLAG